MSINDELGEKPPSWKADAKPEDSTTVVTFKTGNKD